MNGKDEPTGDRSSSSDTSIGRRRLLQFAGIGLVGTAAAATKASGQTSTDRLELVADGEKIEYTFTCGGRIDPVKSKGFTSALRLFFALRLAGFLVVSSSFTSSCHVRMMEPKGASQTMA